MSSVKHTTLFGFPVMIQKIDQKSYNKKSIISTIEKNFKLNKHRNLWDVTCRPVDRSVLHHAFKDFDNPKYHKVNFDTLVPVYKKVISKILDNFPMTPVDFEFTISNYTCLSNSNYMASHLHPSSDFSAVHYIQFDKEHHTGTTFENSLSHVEYIGELRPELTKIFSPSHAVNSWIYGNWEIGVDEDDFCFSPSFLRHKIEPQISPNKNRITIALNITLKRKI